MDDKVMGQLGLRMQVSAMKLEKWIMIGLRKLYPGLSDAQLRAGLAAAVAKAGDNAYEQDQILAELVHKFKAVGHTVDSLDA
jgi:hypothetical protein